MEPVFKPGSAEAEAKAEIIELDRRWTKAYVERDIETLESLMSDEFVTTDPSGKTYLKGKRQNIDGVKSGEVTYESFDLEDVDVKVHGDTAIAVGRFMMKGKAQNEPIGGRFSYTEAWVKRNGQWQAIAEHLTEILS